MSLGSLRTLLRQRNPYDKVDLVDFVRQCGSLFGYRLNDASTWIGIFPGNEHPSYQLELKRHHHLSQIEIHTGDRTYRIVNLKLKSANSPAYDRTCDSAGRWRNLSELEDKILDGLSDGEIY